MKYIIFTIKTAYSEENYFLTVNDTEAIELQIDKALAEICYCDNYEIISYTEVTKEYIEERNKAIVEYENLFNESVENSFCSGKYTTLEAIKDDIEYRKNA